VLVGVVIPAHNAAAFLGECLDSVVAQAGPLQLDIVVVDDGSTDQTADVARAHESVRVIRLGVNQGPSAARNAGIAATRGEFVAFLDADDLWPAGSLAARVEVLQRHPAAALVFGDCRQFDDHGPRPRTLFEAGGLGAAAWGSGEIVPDGYQRLLADNFIATGTVLVRRAALDAAGGFAQQLRLVEDLDLWLRVARQHPLAWCRQTCLLRRRHGRNLSRDPRAMSLAYLEVLRRQTPRPDVDAPGLAHELTALAAKEQLHLADLALASGRSAEALHWASQSLRARPSARALTRVARAFVARWSPRVS
jgi:glycosyltransferase involved in cell wall biosynthesis